MLIRSIVCRSWLLIVAGLLGCTSSAPGALEVPTAVLAPRRGVVMAQPTNPVCTPCGVTLGTPVEGAYPWDVDGEIDRSALEANDMLYVNDPVLKLYDAGSALLLTTTVGDILPTSASGGEPVSGSDRVVGVVASATITWDVEYADHSMSSVTQQIDVR